jgi:hypothetical protein
VLISTLVGVIVLALLQMIPLVGALALGLFVVLGLGGWTVYGYRAYTARRA